MGVQLNTNPSRCLGATAVNPGDSGAMPFAAWLAGKIEEKYCATRTLTENNHQSIVDDILKQWDGYVTFKNFENVRHDVNSNLSNFLSGTPAESRALIESASEHIFELLLDRVQNGRNSIPDRRRPAYTVAFNRDDGYGGRFDFWNKNLRTGIYRSGTFGALATPHASYGATVGSYREHGFDLKLDLMGAAFAVLTSNDARPNMVGVLPSALAFAGYTKAFGLFDLRAAAQIKYVQPIARNYSSTPDGPSEVALALRFMPTPRLSFVTGARLLFNFDYGDIQNSGSLRPVFDHGQVFLNARIPWLDAEVDLAHYGSDLRVRGRVGTSFFRNSWRFGIFASADKGVQTSEPPLYPDYVAANFSINWEGRDWRAKATGTAGALSDAGAKGRSTHDEKGLVPGTVSWQRRNLGAGYEIECGMSESEGQQNFFCKFPNGAAKCTGTLDRLHCESGLEYDLTFEREKAGEPWELIFKIEAPGTIPASKRALSTIFDNPDLPSFVRALSSASLEEKLAALKALAEAGYETYNYENLVGNDSATTQTNTISAEEIYKQVHLFMFDPKSADLTTVCRGFAKFIATVAEKIGLESHTEVIQTPTAGHVIAMIYLRGAKRPEAGSFAFINYGDNVYRTNARSKLEALDMYTDFAGYPIQLKYSEYDSQGRFQNIIYSREGAALYEGATPDEAARFIEFR